MQTTLGLKNQARTQADFLNLDILDRALQAKACHMINITLTSYNASQENNKKKDNELFQSAKLAMVKTHMKYLQFTIFRHQIEKASLKDERVRKYLFVLAKILVLDDLLSDGAAVYDTGYFAPGSLRPMQEAME